MAADIPPPKRAKGGKNAGSEGGMVRGNCQSWGSVDVLLTVEYGMAIGMVDCDQYLVKDNLAALVGKRAQTNEGMGGRGQDMACHC